MGCAGIVVVLNGPPHSGKSEIIKSFQELSSQPFFTFGIESLYRLMEPIDSEKALGQNKAADSIYMRGLHAAISGMARGGCNIIVDHTILEKEWYEELKTYLEGLDVIWIEAKCDKKILEERERELGPKPEGDTNSILSRMLGGISYDLSIDCGKDSYETCASKIDGYLNGRHVKLEPRARWATLCIPHSDTKPGTVIIVAGTTSAGKSTLCRNIQRSLDDPCIQFGIDNQVEMIAKKYLGVPLTKEEIHNFKPKHEQNLGFYLVPPGTNEDNPFEYAILQIGPVARLLMSAHYYGVKYISLAGINVVCDLIFAFEDLYLEVKEVFGDIPVLWVSISADKEILLEHEKRRGDRVPGHTIGLFEQMYKDIPFDLEIDSGKLSPEEETGLVIKKLNDLDGLN